jgi:diadenosine tetraphosphatase ApaH/serine/threonine PP2A family protein phosphatase
MSRIALISDVHGNLPALEAVLAALGPVDALWVTGDSVGYGPDPSDVLALLTERRARVVAGNHDLAVATGAGLELFNPHAAAAARLHHRWLSAEERDRLGSLPLTIEADGTADRRLGFTLCHGSLRDPVWEYVLSARQALATLRLAGTPNCAIGHTHVPALYRSAAGAPRPAAEGYGLLAAEPLVAAESFVVGEPVRIEGRMLVNSGSVGQPRDGDPRAAYAVLDTDPGTITFDRTPYDVHETQRRMRARGLPEFLADRLAVGF